jgi:ubiquinone/menaquinone biosynthesis C-methylase UbiE
MELRKDNGAAAESNGRGLLAPARRFDPDNPELMDRPGVDEASLREELQILEDTNLRFGGHQLALHYVRNLVDSTRNEPLRILDLGTGAADIPRVIAGWLRKRNRPVSITAVDRNPGVLRLASEWSREWPEIQFEEHDLLALPYPPGSYDLVMCSLALHHFTSADAVKVLRRVHELARVGYIINDLRRNWLTIWTTEILARTVMQSGIARNDGPQSSRAAFTIEELRRMARDAGMTNFRVRRHHLIFRMVLEGRK